MKKINWTEDKATGYLSTDHNGHHYELAKCNATNSWRMIQDSTISEELKTYPIVDVIQGDHIIGRFMSVEDATNWLEKQ